MKIPVPTEDQEQRTVCQWMELHGIVFAHVPNGGSRRTVEAKIFKALGVKAGVPDLLVFDPPPRHEECRGVAIEMKRKGRDKEKDGGVSDEQRWWLERLKERNWAVTVAYGADQAINFLEQLGYGRRVG